ncbi:cytochrome P450 [Acidipropionibacterium virtanenii]|uniref:Fatty-acid peroxygenase n=1 Tax=Acidipropionibacterium virtanenii TaxID=2057246 RepID=A0A344UR25_9ACTN|nr:cytochrome P450 [Acidipropionibacterium virtanenii]AXE37723.1 Fatty-acid peroxygenase [Acidipropionibacterium virtanenii]
MTSVPFDSTVALLREGYPFVSARCDALGTDLFTSRIALQRVTFMRGAPAAELFYSSGHFTRRGAVPPTVQHLLQDKGSVQGLDGAAHRHRKHAFLAVMGPDAMPGLGDLFEQEWRAALQRHDDDRFVLNDLAEEILTRTACRWSGIPTDRVDVERLTRELSLMVGWSGSQGPGNWYAQWRRRGTERWAAELVEQVRRGELAPEPGTALRVLAEHADENGEELPSELAAVELINVLRPMLAIARFITFAAVALHENPKWRERFAAGDVEDLEPFVQEVRRYYPFFPVVPGRTVDSFTWDGHRFDRNEWVILDLYGTCHDRRLWDDPEAFEPERFRGWSWDDDPYSMIAQGAGDHAGTHRCPGEWSTVELLRRAVVLLSTSGLTVPAQDLTVPLNRFPTMPRSGVVLARG